MNSQPSPLIEQTSQQYLIRHVIVEANLCPFETLNDFSRINNLLVEIASIIDTEIMTKTSYHFEPYGVTSVLIVGASHLSAHTWPEHGYATVDLVVCREDFSISEIVNHIKERLAAGRVSYLEFRRGLVG